jgi:hypothetical protein
MLMTFPKAQRLMKLSGDEKKKKEKKKRKKEKKKREEDEERKGKCCARSRGQSDGKSAI